MRYEGLGCITFKVFTRRLVNISPALHPTYYIYTTQTLFSINCILYAHAMPPYIVRVQSHAWPRPHMRLACILHMISGVTRHISLIFRAPSRACRVQPRVHAWQLQPSSISYRCYINSQKYLPKCEGFERGLLMTPPCLNPRP